MEKEMGGNVIMKDVFVISDNVISSLGTTTEELFDALLQNKSGFEFVTDTAVSNDTLPLSRINYNVVDKQIEELGLHCDSFPLFEKLLILSITKAATNTGVDLTSADTLCILSSTKGNIDLLENEKKAKFGRDRVYLHRSADELQKFFSFRHTPLVISNACISGILALITAQRLLSSGKYKNIIVAGADIISKFVVSGFQSFKSLSPVPCKPFDKDRVGLSLGEGVATVILSNNTKSGVKVLQGASANDANHISGPSRTGEGLFNAIQSVLQGRKDVDYISAHGTATPYNDDMESKALKRSGLENVPVNSFKGYFGHTLGAAGLIEAIAGYESMKRNVLIKTLGTETVGVAEDINVILENRNQEIKRFLKIGSGFGGCNAALLFEKYE